MYPMTAFCPDMAYAIGVLRRYNQDASNEHTIALQPVFRYLNGTKDSQLHFGGEDDVLLGCHIDSDHAGCPGNNKSTGGLFITFG
jgi:hypothetical protein